MPGMAAVHAATPSPPPSCAKPVGTLKCTCHREAGAWLGLGLGLGLGLEFGLGLGLGFGSP